VRASTEEKQKSRARILRAASQRFRKDGLQGAGLAEIMKDAGLTHGGFYKHFADKDALVRAALDEAFAGLLAPLAAGPDTTRADAFRTLYLSPGHRDSPEAGCPVAALGAEVARAGPATRQAMTDGVEAFIAVLRGGPDGPPLPRADALRQLAALVGAMVIARAVEGPLSDEVLDATRETVPPRGR
jgi:TetR/AcrR family transcriptional repressor of nem operon